MNILVTGANGFIGRSFIDYCLQILSDEDMIFAVVRNGCELSASPQLKYIYHNDYLIDRNELAKCDSVDVVVHLGGTVPLSSSKTTYDDMVSFSRNLNTTIEMLSVLPNIPKKIIYASSVMVYSDTKGVIDENLETNPSHFYGLTKLACERLLKAYSEENNVTLQIVRIGQVYGAGERSRLIIPTLIHRAINDEEFQIFSNGDELRSFIHVRDVARLLYNSIYLQSNNIINLASAKAYSVKMIASIIMQIEQKENLIKVLNRDIQTKNFIYDCKKMHELIGIENVDFKEGILEEYLYMKEN